jgi:tetratricopeptide (TPR) repeat protein
MAWSQTAADPCDEQATCQAQRGAQLLAQGRVEEAAIALEKALLLDPNLPGAQLDYAQALAQIGLKGSARAILADVLKRPDIQPALKSKLAAPTEPSGITSAGMPNEWQWSTLGQAAVGHETNLNSANFTDSLTLMLSNGPVTIGLSDSAKPISGPAAKTLLAVQGTTRAGSGLLALGELSVSASLSNKNALQNDSLTGLKPERNQTAEAVAKYSLPMIAGAASGQWQFSAGGTQFWLGSTSAYSDTGYNVKFNWDRTFEPNLKGLLNIEGQSCKLAPSLGKTHQSFPLSSSLNGVYSFARMELLCKAASNESQIVLGKGFDKAAAGRGACIRCPGGTTTTGRITHITRNINLERYSGNT